MAFENVSFKEAETLVNNPSYSKITTNNRFNILNNLQNFPPLPQTTSDINKQAVPNLIGKPSVNNNSKKRKANTPPVPPRDHIKIAKSKSQSQPIIPNPYRDEFIQYKEKLITQIAGFVENYLAKFIHVGMGQVNPKLNVERHKFYLF